ncbi:MoaD/ThiS family protein [Helicobacter apodemus]|uniref:Molybdopterin synthase sulfur carrier subunit n=1 Tax=Helicobacter apodemus TaxID=135569 RepID=A0A2U8FDE2_9HELI|nr:MoaD/ThiS family protein [Helicobacter apodemus]AWI33857.1 molybdopterin synthase sulfur carrier subunit [Helicobacter apodemus]
MIEIEFLGPLGNKVLQSNAKDFYDLKEELQQIPEIRIWLKDCAIALNNEIITSLDTPLKSGDRVLLLPPVCGG